MKKFISCLAVFGMMAAMAVSAHAANNPKLTLDVSSTGLSAGDTVTITAKFSGYNDVSPYDDVNTGNGSKLTGAQVRFNVPGGIGKAAAGKQFKSLGIKYNNLVGSGSITDNGLNTDADTIAAVIYGASAYMNPTGDLFSVEIKLNKDVTEDLTFTVDTTYQNLVIYDTYEEEEYVGTYGQDPATDCITNTASCTLKAPTPTSTTSIGAATKGGDLDRQKTFYAPITIDTSAQTGARFWVSNGTKTKSWEIPSGIVGVANFYAVVKTAETGTYTYNVVESDGTTAIGTAQTVTID